VTYNTQPTSVPHLHFIPSFPSPPSLVLASAAALRLNSLFPVH
jgi:hypothetical protein